MHLSANIIRSPASQNLIKKIEESGKISHETHGDMVTKLSTQRGGFEWRVDVADGDWIATALKMWMLPFDADKLAEIGFHPLSEPLEELMARHELELAHTFLDLSTRVVANYIDVMRLHMGVPPYSLCALVSKSEPVRTRAFERLRLLWNVLEVFEDYAIHANFTQEYIKNLLWPLNGWCCEVFIGAAENDFKLLPTVVEEEVYGVFHGMGASIAVERVLNDLRNVERLHSAGKLGRVNRWHKASVSISITEWDRKPVPILPEDKVNAAKFVSKTIFEAKKATLRQGADIIDEIKSGVGFANPNPENYLNTTYALHQMLQTESLASIRISFVGLLCQRLSIIRNRAKSALSGLVDKVTNHGVLVFKVRAMTLGGCQCTTGLGDEFNETCM